MIATRPDALSSLGGRLTEPQVIRVKYYFRRIASRNFLTICLTRILTFAPSRCAWQLYLYFAHFGALIWTTPG
jgi:hypothetical protein